MHQEFALSLVHSPQGAAESPLFVTLSNRPSDNPRNRSPGLALLSRDHDAESNTVMAGLLSLVSKTS
jgi:hypothetical protein